MRAARRQARLQQHPVRAAGAAREIGSWRYCRKRAENARNISGIVCAPHAYCWQQGLGVRHAGMLALFL